MIHHPTFRRLVWAVYSMSMEFFMHSYLMRWSLALLLLSLALPPTMTAEVSLSERVNQAAMAFEERQDREFKPVAASLETWRKNKLNAASKDINDLLTIATPADKPFLAYHLLSINPRHKNARAVFTQLGIPAPFDEQGNPVPDAKIPKSSNRVMVEKVSTFRYPPFSAVAEAVSPKAPAVASYWKQQSAALKDLRTKLLDYSEKGEAANAFQVLAYYWPNAKEVVSYYASIGRPIPRQRTWFSGVDRYLLDNGLAGLDCLDTKYTKPSSGPVPAIGIGGAATFSSPMEWSFSENLRNCRVEGLLKAKEKSEFTILDNAGSGACMAISGKEIELFAIINRAPRSLVKTVVEEDFASAAVPVQFEVRGTFLFGLVGGIQVCSAELPNDHAYSRFQITPGSDLVAQHLRVRYLSDLAKDLLGNLVGKPPAETEEPWLAERKKQLDKPVTFKFEDTSIEEAVTMLSQLTGVKITSDSKAETLKSLPVTLDGKGLKLASALDWLHRVSDLSWKSTADGVQLTWSK